VRKHRLKIVLVILITIIGGTLLIRACLPPTSKRNLIARATKLSNVRDGLSYSWISNTELIVSTSTNGYPVMRFPWTGSVVSIDASTGKGTHLSGLSAAIMQHSRS